MSTIAEYTNMKIQEFVSKNFPASMQKKAEEILKSASFSSYGKEEHLMTLIDVAKKGDEEQLKRVFKNKTSWKKVSSLGGVHAYEEEPDLKLNNTTLELLFASDNGNAFLDCVIADIKESYKDRGQDVIDKKIQEVQAIFDKVSEEKMVKTEEASTKSSNDLDAILGSEESEKGKSSQKGSQKD